MKLMDPRITQAAPQLYRAPAPVSLAGCTIGLLSNGKLNADLLLERTAAELRRRHGGTVLPLQYKSNPSAPASTELLTGLAPECDYLLTATGD